MTHDNHTLSTVIICATGGETSALSARMGVPISFLSQQLPAGVSCLMAPDATTTPKELEACARAAGADVVTFSVGYILRALSCA